MSEGSTVRSPLVNVFYAALCCLGGLFVANLVLFIILEPLFGIDMVQLTSVLSQPDNFPEARNAVMFSQLVSATAAFIIGPVIYFQFFQPDKFTGLNRIGIQPMPLIVAGLVMFTVMPFLSVIIKWNAEMDFPAIFKDFETYALAQERQMERLTVFLTSFDGIGQLLFGLLAMAVIPAIGEELLFRGVLQTQVRRLVGNPHLAIVIAAFVFSFIHMQFYGFVPRLLLGMLLGYLYWLSGNIWVAILGHFLNNAYAICAVYFLNGVEPELLSPSETAISPWLAAVSIFLTLGLLYLLWRWHFQRSVTTVYE